MTDMAGKTEPPTTAEVEMEIDRVMQRRERCARVEQQCARIVADARSEMLWSEERAQAVIEAFFDAHPPRRGRTIHLHTGSISRRTTPGRWSCDDEIKLLAWARTECPQAIAVREYLQKIAVYEHIDTTGEIPDGVAWKNPTEKTSVTTARSGQEAEEKKNENNETR